MDTSEFSLHAELEDHHWWFVARREILLTLLRRHVAAHEHRLVVEIGCGTGGNLKRLQHYYRVMGVEIAPAAAEFARLRVDCPILVGNFVECLAPFWGEIDAVLLPDVLEHVADDRHFLQQIIGEMRPGAMLLLTVPAAPFLWSSHDETLRHFRRYSAAALRQAWRGLPVQECFFSPFNTLLSPPIAAYRLLDFGGRARGKSHLERTPAGLNRLLCSLFSAERLWLERFSLPFGCSYCAVLKKSEDGR